ncbi:MAG: hypothetical protein IH627_14570 [Rubrivivax sp.]|nr:hypothetical protein [Rubrivivax sp.]
MSDNTTTNTNTSSNAITIDGKAYELDKLSEAALQQLKNIRMADQELARLQMQQALVQTARSAYGHVLQAELAKVQS